MVISGIQQMGIGNPNTPKSFEWYRTKLKMDVRIFDEKASAALMLPYTGGQARDRHAILAVNMQGGGGFEIWQYVGREPLAPSSEIIAGDLGIFVCKIKSKNVEAAYNHYKNEGVFLLSDIQYNPSKTPHFFFKDLNGNIFQVEQHDNIFVNNSDFNGGVLGAIIGVSDMKKSIKFYSEILGYKEIIYDKIDVFADLKSLPNGDDKFHRVMLEKNEIPKGPFGPMLGPSRIELIQKMNGGAKKIFENRLWGDLGFIHLCFDIVGMDELRNICKNAGCSFTVDTGNSFDMGEAAGAFAYIEDPDGTLIEFVETHKVPVFKKIGWYFNLKGRDPNNSLPRWMLKALSLNRVK